MAALLSTSDEGYAPMRPVSPWRQVTVNYRDTLVAPWSMADHTGWLVVGPGRVGFKPVEGRAFRPGLLTSSPRRGMITT